MGSAMTLEAAGFLTLAAVAARCGVSTDTVRHRLAAHGLTAECVRSGAGAKAMLLVPYSMADRLAAVVRPPAGAA